MKKLKIITLIAVVAFALSCNNVKRHPGFIYMPDMAYSRAYETYIDHSNLAEEHIFYNNMPVAGTIARGEELPFPLAKDAVGDSANYVASKKIISPIEDSLSTGQLKEAERLYLINCGICHGVALDGNGPLYKGGNGPFPAAPKNLAGDPNMISMPEGQMFYSATYGKNLMGSYASQLNRYQRWMVIRYIKTKQAANAKAAKAPASKDSTASAKK